MKISKFAIHGTISGPIKVVREDQENRVVKTFGNDRDAGKFALGCGVGYDEAIRDVIRHVEDLIPTEGVTYTGKDWADAIREEFA